MRLRIAWVIALFALLVIINTFPLVLHPGSTIGQHGDAYFSVWRLAWVAHQLRADPCHLFDGNIFFPHRDTLAYSDAMLLPAVALAPLNWIGLDPLVVYNLTLLLAFIASAVAAFLLVRELTGSTPAGLIGGIIFAFSAHRFGHFDHLELQFAFWIPLAVMHWHRAVTRDRGYLIVGVLTACQVLSSIYHGIYFAAWLAVATLLWFIRSPLNAARAALLILWLPLATLAIYSAPYLKSRSEVGDRSLQDVLLYSAQPRDFLNAPSSSVLYGWTDSRGGSELHLFPGVIASSLLIVGLWPPLDRTRAVHAGALAFAVLLTFGLHGPIYRLLYDWLLPFRGLRVPARAGILVLLGTSVLAGFGLARLLAVMTRRRMAVIAAAAAVTTGFVECLARPALIPASSVASVWYSWLRTLPDAVIFEWPVTVPWRLEDMVDVRYMYRSTLHWRPMLNGYSGHYPDSYMQLLYAMRSFPYTPALAELRRRGATVLIVHEVPGSRPSYKEAVERLVRDPRVQVLAEDMDAGRGVMFFRLLGTTSAQDESSPSQARASPVQTNEPGSSGVKRANPRANDVNTPSRPQRREPQ
jgi:hypothetical protein